MSDFKPMVKLAAAISLTLLLQACAAAVVAGGASAVTSASDRRTLGSQIDDNGIVIKARRALSQDGLTAKGSNINVTSYNGVVLLTGQTASEQVKEAAFRAWLKAKEADGYLIDFKIHACLWLAGL